MARMARKSFYKDLRGLGGGDDGGGGGEGARISARTRRMSGDLIANQSVLLPIPLLTCFSTVRCDRAA